MSPAPLYLTRLVGSQESMGAQHGALTAPYARRLFEFYARMPERALAGGLDGVSKLAIRTLAGAWQARLHRQRPPELAARSRAFATAVAKREGMTLDVERSIQALAAMDVLQNCVSLFARARLGPFSRPLRTRATVAAAPACSTAIAWGRATEDGELLFARNFDFPGVGVWDAAPAFVLCVPDGDQRYGFFATRGADAPAVTVVNEAGLVFATHTRWHAGVTWGGGMAIDVVHQLARTAETLADAVQLARELRGASSSWGVAVGSAREKTGLVLEIAGPNVEVVRPALGADHLICANHYRSTIKEGELAPHAWDLHSVRRAQRLNGLIEARPAPLAARDLARFLGDRCDIASPGCQRQFGGQLAQAVNVHSVVVAPGAQRAWVGVDRAPVCEGTWAELAWQWDGPAGGWELGATDGSGFTATTHDDFVAQQSEVTRLVHDAVRVFEHDHDIPAARDAIERAVELAPREPSLRLTAAWLALEDNANERAAAHIAAGLAVETDTYRRGQLLLWGARAARRSDPVQAQRWSAELDLLDGAGIDELRARARARYRGGAHANLLMVDAY
ncbi:MAG: C45 family autoproteolytic acyltransferase/hydrolase [Kofleriaceae bacterium]|nr:C45 family autoproteolytic acyltransferase/hydrolase [Kofleriaceae bacterium]